VETASERGRERVSGYFIRPAIGVMHGERRPWQSRFAFWLAALFVLSLPFVNPWVRGDGVGYYAYVRALLIDHDLNFEQDWLHGNASFVDGRVDPRGQILASQYTSTGHLDNHFSTGPALLWAPFLAVTHGIVIAADRLGLKIPADGFSWPYRIAMALSTAIYGFAGLLLAFDLARQYFGERWSFLATIAIWFASSFPVYMYFNPSWSHAHSGFAVSLFLWYWHRTREKRGRAQWALLGSIAGLMIDVYYLNAAFLLVLAPEAVAAYGNIFRAAENRARRILLSLEEQGLFASAMVFLLGLTLITRRIIYGNAFESGYPPLSTWLWSSPKIFPVLFSADHGMLTWTPVLALALAGLVMFARIDWIFGSGLLLAFLAFFYGIASYVNWDGLSSFGNRFFVSFTPVFVIGLAALLEGVARRWRVRPPAIVCALTLLVLWNFGFMFQWGTQMIPAQGAISWNEVVQNQFAVVPRSVAGGLYSYFADRGMLMREIEKSEMRRNHQQK
jgi:Dolichyl-phosphate-mannose-protein mannosyltransferase